MVWEMDHLALLDVRDTEQCSWIWGVKNNKAHRCGRISDLLQLLRTVTSYANSEKAGVNSWLLVLRTPPPPHPRPSANAGMHVAE